MLKVCFRTLSSAFISQFSSNFVSEFILGRSSLGLKIGKALSSNKYRVMALDLC